MSDPHEITRKAVDSRRYDYLLRSATTSVLALIIVAVAAYQAIVEDRDQGLFHDAALLVVGVFFGAHYGQNSHGLPRMPRRTDNGGA